MTRPPGWKHSSESRLKIREHKLGEHNPLWAGDNVGYAALHEWVRARITKPSKCEVCHIKSPIDLACKSGVYNREVANWQWLCRSCHMKIDGRLARLQQIPFLDRHLKRGRNGRFVKVR